MAPTTCNRGRFNSPWDSCRGESTWEPVEIVLFPPSSSSGKRERPESKSDLFAKRARTSDRTKVDWLETEEAHVFKADLPGIKKGEIKVELEEDQVLQISGERSHYEEKKGDIWHVVERSHHSKFLRRFKLPGAVEADSVSAKVEDGVLTVTVLKALPKKPQTRSIEVS